MFLNYWRTTTSIWSCTPHNVNHLILTSCQINGHFWASALINIFINKSKLESWIIFMTNVRYMCTYIFVTVVVDIYEDLWSKFKYTDVLLWWAERERKMTIKIVKTMRYGYQKLRRKRKTTFNRLNEEKNTSKYSSENSGLKFTQNASKVKIFIGLKLWYCNFVFTWSEIWRF